MPALPKIPFTAIDSLRVAVDAPVSTDLMTDMATDLNYLYSVVSDGASAVAGISAKAVTTNGALTVNGNASVTGTLNTGVFFSSEQLLFLTGF